MIESTSPNFAMIESRFSLLNMSCLQNICDIYHENVYPSKGKVFNAFSHFNQKDLKVVILGQDCYHGEDQANGLAFSVNNGISHPPSLVNIFKEYLKLVLLI